VDDSEPDTETELEKDGCTETVDDSELEGEIVDDPEIEMVADREGATSAYEIENIGSPFALVAIGTGVGNTIVVVEFC